MVLPTLMCRAEIDARDRRADLGVAQLEACAVVGRLQRVEVELGVLGRALGDEALVSASSLLALVVALELAQVGFRLLRLRAAGRSPSSRASTLPALTGSPSST